MNKTTPHNVIIWLWDATSFYDSKGQRVPLTNAQSSLMNLFAEIEIHKPYESLQCRRILGGRKLLYCNHHLCYDGERLGRVKTVTLTVGARAKEGKRGGGGEKNTLLSPRPLPDSFWLAPFSPLFSTCAFARKTFAHTKKTTALQATTTAVTATGTSIRLRGSLSENRPLHFAWKKICLKLWQVIVKGFIENMRLWLK